MTAPNSCGSGNRAEYCPAFHRTIEMIGRRWTGVVLLQLAGGELQYGSIKTGIPGISDRLLSERLKELEAAQILARSRTGRDVTYALTDRGRDLLPILNAVFDFNETWESGSPVSAAG